MAEIVCPECGTRTELPAIRRAAEEFCGHCDYPLFWAPSTVPATRPGVTSDATLRRLPGAGGRQRVGSKVCPVCGELNPLTETHCLRCRSELDPRPPEPPPPVVVVAPQPEPVFVPPPEPERGIPWWWWALGAAAVAVIVTVIVLAIVL